MARRLPRGERGFTLIELMIVILLVGILAAIALPAFLGQQKKGDDAIAKANARDLVTYVEACNLEKNDLTRCATQAESEAKDLDWGTGPGQVSVTDSTRTTYEIVAVSNTDTGGTSHTFTIARAANGRRTHSCAAGPNNNDGGCNNGAW